MLPQEFFTKIVEEYHLARCPVLASQKIVRGRSRSVSALAEEAFAGFLVDNDQSIQQIFVDQPFTTASPVDGKKRTTYPDLAVVKSDEIVALFDFKMDMGWNRNGLDEICKKHNQFVLGVRGMQLSYSPKSAPKSDKPISVNVSRGCTYDIIIATSMNWNKAGVNQLTSISEVYDAVSAYLLSEGTHPNDRDFKKVEDVVASLKIRHNDFEQILSKMR